MSRAARLLDLLETLRAHRRPVTAEHLAAQSGVSVRTVYRDIDTLVGQGAPIEGEAGVGYLLRPGFTLPPLMFGDREIEALALGLRWVAMNGGDPALATAARGALAKIDAVLPASRQGEVHAAPLLAGPSAAGSSDNLPALRDAARSGRKLRLGYRDGAGRTTDRVVWPLALSYFDEVRILVAWCETRGDFRHFRADRIDTATPLPDRIPHARSVLLARWRAQESVPDTL